MKNFNKFLMVIVAALMVNNAHAGVTDFFKGLFGGSKKEDSVHLQKAMEKVTRALTDREEELHKKAQVGDKKAAAELLEILEAENALMEFATGQSTPSVLAEPSLKDQTKAAVQNAANKVSDAARDAQQKAKETAQEVEQEAKTVWAKVKATTSTAKIKIEKFANRPAVVCAYRWTRAGLAAVGLFYVGNQAYDAYLKRQAEAEMEKVATRRHIRK